MRILLLTLALLFPQSAMRGPILSSTPAGLPPGPTFVNAGADYTGGGSYTTAWSPTNGNTLIVISANNSTTLTATCSDGEGTGNTYTPDGAATVGVGAGANAMRIFHASNISGSGNYTVTCTGTTPSVQVIEISGNRTLDTASSGTNPSFASNGASTSPLTPTALTPTTAATILVDSWSSVGSTNPTSQAQVDTNFTLLTDKCTNGTSCYLGSFGYRVVASSASYSDGWNGTLSNEQIAVVAAYK